MLVFHPSIVDKVLNTELTAKRVIDMLEPETVEREDQEVLIARRKVLVSCP